ncbi:MAG: ribulose-phosphate 3-epimerase [Clostridia bacterium]
MIKIEVAPSILSADFGKMAEAVQNLELWQADLVHCDVMDGVFVPNLTFGMPMIKALRKYTKGILDVHLMIVKPERYIQQFISAGADIVTFHPDASDDVLGALNLIKSAGKKCGLVLNPDKPISLIEPYLDLIDVVIIMGVYAGFGGQKFILDTLDKIRDLKALIGNRNIKIEMDGGATLENVKSIALAGTDIIVAGSAVFNAENPAEAVKSIRNCLL